MKQHLCWLILIYCTANQSAWAVYCGNYLLETGQYKREVLRKCGEPDSVDTHIEKRAVALSANISQLNGNQNFMFPNTVTTIGGQQITEIDVVVEEWLYNFGQNRFQQLLRFENGKLIDIKELGYGY